MPHRKITPWFRRLIALAELTGDHTQQDIAARLGVSPAAVSSWGRGRLPAAQTVIKAAQVYEADPTELLQITFLSGDCRESFAEAPRRNNSAATGQVVDLRTVKLAELHRKSDSPPTF